MKLIGFSRKKPDDKTVIKAVFDVIAPQFGRTDFNFNSSVNSKKTYPFSFERGIKNLQKDNCLGFWKEKSVAVWIDNQAHSGGYFTCPHSTIEIESLSDEENGNDPIKYEVWLETAKNLVELTGLDLVLVLGNQEKVADYWRTPLGFRIGLIKVFWIMCFGESYSKLISSNQAKTEFFSRDEYKNGTIKTFVCAPTFDRYLVMSPDLLTLQKKEIGKELFHCLPVEERRGGGEGHWLFHPKSILKILTVIIRKYSKTWSKYQAKVVPND